MPTVAPSGYDADTAGNLIPNGSTQTVEWRPTYVKRQTCFRCGCPLYDGYPFTVCDDCWPTRGKLPESPPSVSIDWDALTRAAHPEWPEAMRAEEV